MDVRLPVWDPCLRDEDEMTQEQMQRIWARRAALLAREVVQTEAGEQIDWVLVRLGRGVYALEATYVFDIKPVARITPVPRTPEWIAGVVNIRGRILSVIDLRRFLGVPRLERESVPYEAYSNGALDVYTGYLVVIETPDTSVSIGVPADSDVSLGNGAYSNNTYLEGALVLLVDDVLTVHTVPVNDIQAADEVIVLDIRSDYVRGVIEPAQVARIQGNDDQNQKSKPQNDLWVILDLLVLLSDERLIVRHSDMARPF
ncbi:MAG: chemotaxis protein CheW [Anaerolineae bacterium]|nr:chemotaxis protein CheW [Anaerolineae bacterium]